MTTNSVAYYGRMAIDRVKEKRPDIEVKSIIGSRFGPVRVAKITLVTGEFVQTPLPPLGSGGYACARAIEDAIVAMRKVT
jgi:hypothetical protein